MASKEEGAYTAKPSKVQPDAEKEKTQLTAEECFEEAAKWLRQMADPVKRAELGYAGRGTAESWMDLGLAIKGTRLRGRRDSILDEE